MLLILNISYPLAKTKIFLRRNNQNAAKINIFFWLYFSFVLLLVPLIRNRTLLLFCIFLPVCSQFTPKVLGFDLKWLVMLNLETLQLCFHIFEFLTICTTLAGKGPMNNNNKIRLYGNYETYKTFLISTMDFVWFSEIFRITRQFFGLFPSIPKFASHVT